MAVITVSRQYGSGGDEIAARVCELLGYSYFDKALIAQVAAEMGLSEQEWIDFSEENYKMQSFMDKVRNWRRASTVVAQVETVAVNADTGFKYKTVVDLDEAHSVALIRTTIQAAYKQGNMVVVGRGGQAILSDKPDVLHVRVKAPLDARVQRLHRRENYSLGGAQDIAIKRDRAAADYLRHFYDIDWADPIFYDLVINTNKLNTEAAAQLIVQAVGYLPAAEA